MKIWELWLFIKRGATSVTPLTYPKDFEERRKLYEPYIENGTLEQAPQEIKDAYEINKKWLWDIGQ